MTNVKDIEFEVLGEAAPALDDVRQGNGVIKSGMTGDAVSFVQKAVAVTVDGKFGKNTKAAVKNFQRNHNLKADGIVGKNTLAAIDAAAGAGAASGPLPEFHPDPPDAPPPPPSPAPPAPSSAPPGGNQSAPPSSAPPGGNHSSAPPGGNQPAPPSSASPSQVKDTSFLFKEYAGLPLAYWGLIGIGVVSAGLIIRSLFTHKVVLVAGK